MPLTSADVHGAIQALPDEGGVVHLQPATYEFEVGVDVPRNVHIQGVPGATRIEHYGADEAFYCRDSDPFDVFARRSLSGVRIIGNPNPNAVGVNAGDQWGFRLHEVVIDGYSGGRGLKVRNEGYWSEGFDFDGVHIRGCKTGIELSRGDGNDSFGYQRWRNVSIQVPAGCVGLDIGGPVNRHCYLYNSDLDMVFWLDGPGATAVRVRSWVNAPHNRLYLTGEASGSGRTGVTKASAATFTGYGVIDIQGAPSNMASTSTLLVRS